MSDEQDRDPGAFIGHEPELSADTIPGGVRPDDERVAGTATLSTGVGAGAGTAGEREPEGHRQGDRASDDDVRRAGENG